MSSVERAVRTPRIRTIQISSLTLIFLISMLNYMDRGTLSIANPLIRNELGLSISQIEVLLSAFLWPYALALLVSGGLVDHWRPRRMLTAAMIVW